MFRRNLIAAPNLTILDWAFGGRVETTKLDWSPEEVRHALDRVCTPDAKSPVPEAETNWDKDVSCAQASVSKIVAKEMASLAGVDEIDREIIALALVAGQLSSGRVARSRATEFAATKMCEKRKLLTALKKIRKSVSILDQEGELSRALRSQFASLLEQEPMFPFAQKRIFDFELSSQASATDFLSMLECSVECTPPIDAQTGRPSDRLQHARMDIALLNFARLRFDHGVEPEKIFPRGDLRYALKLYSIMAKGSSATESAVEKAMRARRRFWKPFVTEFATELVNRQVNGQPSDLPLPWMLVPSAEDEWFVEKLEQGDEMLMKIQISQAFEQSRIEQENAWMNED